MKEVLGLVDECVRIDTRLAGQLKRYHTWPTTGHQTGAEHSWNIIRIYLSVVGEEIDPHIIRHAMFHDIGEHFTGDLPFPVKANNPIIKEQIDFLEHRSMCTQLDYWNTFYQVRLTDADKKLFKQIEVLEMAEFGMDQMNLGNNHGFIIADRCLQFVYDQAPLPRRLCIYISKRLSLFYRQCSSINVYDVRELWWFAEQWEKRDDNSQ
jgi:5'-deoxynucleotidase YfbR-like HD superfamily hydrolase